MNKIFNFSALRYVDAPSMQRHRYRPVERRRMAFASAVLSRRVLLHGMIAGLIGGILIDTFLYLTTIAPNHGRIGSLFAGIASNAIGKSAFQHPSAMWLGGSMHFAVSIAWGLGFAYALTMAPDLLSHPYVAGIVFGVVVQIIMQVVLALSGHFAKPTAPVFATSLLAHTVFFGLPIALYFSRLRHTAEANCWRRSR